VSVNNTGRSQHVSWELFMGIMKIDLLDHSLDALADDSLPAEPPDLQGLG
jgi:hypothetical protein